MADFFVYELLTIGSLPKPILMDTIRASAFYDDDKENFDFADIIAIRGPRFSDSNLIYMFGKDMKWQVYYTKQLPPEYFTVSEGFLVDA